MVLDGGGIAQFGFLSDGNEAFDVVPLALEQRGVVGDGIVAVVGRGNTGNDRELAVFGMLLQAGNNYLKSNLYKSLVLGKLSANKGMMTENLVSQMLSGWL